MGSVYLADYVDNATFCIERGVPRLADGTAHWREVQELCTWYRQRGVCSLLLSGSTSDFYVNMMQSAAAFLHVLAVGPEKDKITSQVKPFFDALCGGYLDAARQIGHLSRKTWNSSMEYEEDFLYALFLMTLLCDPNGSEAAALLERMETAAQGTERTRIEVCHALVERRHEDFEEALSATLSARVDLVEAMIQRGTLSDELAAWLRHFASEGFALVRIAESLGLPLDGHYLHIPAAVRTPSPYPFDPASWRQVEYRI